MYNDKNLTCADCGQEFVFTASEQDFYAQRGFTEPRRCASCRASRKAARNNEWRRRRQQLRLLRRRRGLQRRRQAVVVVAATAAAAVAAVYRDRGPREMFSATCSNCGREAQVPFRPTSGKPVYCSDCFRTMRGGSAY